jgi:hypothetical protein
MSICRFLIFFGFAGLVLIPFSFAEMDLDPGMESLIQDVPAKLEKAAARRPFKFKGMNDSLQWTLEALKALSHSQKTPKAVPMSVWSSNSPLTPAQPFLGLNESQKQALRLVAKARAAYPQNCFVIALKAGILKEAGETAQANGAWEEYLSRSQDYSSFDREFLSRGEFNSLRKYAKNFLHAQGLDFNEAEHQRLLRAPFYERFWHFVIDPVREDRVLNRFFIGAILAGAILFVVCTAAGVEVYRSLGVSLAVLYTAVWLSYGCWIYDRAYGLPWGLNRLRVVAVIAGAALVMSLYEIWTAWRYAHPRLAEGYRRCPHCKEFIVQLSVECEHCRKEIKKK